MTSAKFCRACLRTYVLDGAPFSCTTLSVIAILSMCSFASGGRPCGVPFVPESGCKVTPFFVTGKTFPTFSALFNRD